MTMTMTTTTATFINSINVSTRAKRRQATSTAIALLERIRSAEEASMNRIPENFQFGETFANADYSNDVVITAINLLSDAY